MPNGHTQTNYVLVENIKLFSRGILLKKFRSHLPFRGKNDSILGKDANGCASVGDGFQSVLDLVESSLGGENGCLENVEILASADKIIRKGCREACNCKGDLTYSGIVSTSHG